MRKACRRMYVSFAIFGFKSYSFRQVKIYTTEAVSNFDNHLLNKYVFVFQSDLTKIVNTAQSYYCDNLDLGCYSFVGDNVCLTKEKLSILKVCQMFILLIH
jgi:hypothetical protein